MNELPHATDFPHHFYWLNTMQPLSLVDDLAGYVVLAHFFTSTSVNCHHVFPTLRYLEQRFADRSFAVVGVHCGKYEAEQESDHVEEVIRRFGLRHPVVVDEGNELWEAYGCRAWPSIALIDAVGQLRFFGAGEPDRDRTAGAIGFLLDEAAANGDEPYMELDLLESEDTLPRDGLSFPSDVVFDEAHDLLWIADTARHRVVAVHPADGRMAMVAGTGAPGAADGELGVATFCEPVALALDGESIYVADSGNHLIRRIDISEQTVETFVGTGRPMVDPRGGQAGTEQPINSPWGLAVEDGFLYVAMAGTNQIWRVDLATRTATAYAGGGKPGRADGPAFEASLLAPAGLAASGGQLAFADTGGCSLRVVDLHNGAVRTLHRGEDDLQWPLAVTCFGDDLLIADTLNDKVRRFRPSEGGGELSTLAVDVHRPAGLAVAGDVLYIADAGNDRILRLELTACVVSVLEIHGLPQAPTGFGTSYDRADPITLSSLCEVTLRVPMELPADAVLQPDTRPIVHASNHESYPLLSEMTITPDIEGDHFMIRGVATGADGDGVIRLRLSFVTCKEPGQVCHAHERRFEVPVTLVARTEEARDGGPDEIPVLDVADVLIAKEDDDA